MTRLPLAAFLLGSPAFAQPFAFTYSDARFNGNGHLIRVNLATGATADAGALNATHIEALCLTPTGTLYGLQSGDNFQSWLWDLTTPPGTPIGRDTFSGRIREHPGIAFQPSTGRIWNAQASPGIASVPNGFTALYRINPVSAHVELGFTGPISAGRFMDSIAINGAGDAYGADFARTGQLFRISLTNGSHTVVGPLGIAERNRLSDISFDATGQLWAIAGRGQIYRIDTSTGGATLVSTIDLANQFWTTLAVIGQACYPNCDGSTAPPVLNVNDFVCFQSRFAAGDSYANCDGSTLPPILNISDFICFQGRFAAGCSAP